jgi:4-hydroxy-tetrahydrodipicolinate reductase
MAAHKILIAGAAGRMGRAVAAEVLKTPGVTLAGGFERSDSSEIGADLGHLAGLDALGLHVEDSPKAGLRRASALVDFTAPAASVENARAAAAANVPIVIGTTGFSPQQEDEIRALAERIPIVKSGNMSLGVHLLAALVEEAASRLGEDYDIEVFEAHHRNKTDAPSGTALLLAQAAERGRGADFSETIARARSGAYGREGPRKKGEIGFAVARGGGIVGEHSVMFAGDQEVLTLSHHAIDRGLFARGAIAAAIWAQGKPPGLYGMRDVLGLQGGNRE